MSTMSNGVDRTDPLEQVKQMRLAGKSLGDIAEVVHAAGTTIAEVNKRIGNELLPHHRRELCEESGLSLQTIALAGIRSETNPTTIGLMLNWSKMPKKRGSGIVFPFFDVTGNQTGYSRFKPDSPRQDRDGKRIKYESPRGVPNRVYFPPNTIQYLNNPTVRLILTEGEKKCLKADQEEFPTLGLVGVFGWKAKGHDRLVDDLELVSWLGRPVVIAFDSDATEKEEVRDAEQRLARHLINRGAVVTGIRIPPGPNGEKQGLDDFLVANGAPALHQLLNAGEPIDGLDASSEKSDAKSIDAMKEARAFLDINATHDEERERLLKLRYWRENFYWWGGTHFRELSNDDIRAKLVSFLDVNFFRMTTTAVANTMLCLKAESNVSSLKDMPSWFTDQGEGNFIPLKNGILNVTALIKGDANYLIPHTPRYFSVNVLPYEFDPDATCPKWLAFLERNLEGDAERIAVLQQFFGYTLSATLSAHKFLFNEGEGANGKSVACAALTGMLGSANVSSVPLEAFGERFALFQTVGKMANIAAEVGEVDRVAEGILKSLCSGDPIQFDRKHRDPITARPTAKMVFASNNRPHFSDKSGGLWRRMILMPWRIVIPEAERVRGMDTPDWWRDQGELPGILLWSIAGLWQLEQQGGFTRSEVCEEALSEYRAESNPTRSYLEERFRADPQMDVSCDEVYGPYADWMKRNGFRALSANSFGHEIKRVFPNVARKQIMRVGIRYTVYLGMAKQ